MTFIFFVIVLIAASIGLEWLNTRYKYARLSATIAITVLLFYGLPRLLEGGVTISFPGKVGMMVSIGLVAAYIIGRRGWKLHQLVTGKVRSKTLSAVQDIAAMDISHLERFKKYVILSFMR